MERLLRGHRGRACGKLRAVGRAWARQELIHDPAEDVDLQRDLEAFGLPADHFADRAPVFEGIWEGHLPALGAFLLVQGQWRATSVGLGGIIWQGLDYTALRHATDMAGLDMTPDLFEQLRHIEAGALSELNGGAA